MLDQDFDGRSATAILARVHACGSVLELTVALAGHPAALVIRADGGGVCELGGRGALLGVFSDPQIEQASTVLEPGDSLARSCPRR
jgi:serine phosphatase RsbU (regulator of sigma subunit)